MFTEQSHGSRSTTELFVRALLPLAIVAGGIVGFVVISEKLRKEPVSRELQTPAPIAQVALVQQREGGMTLEADGTVVPYREVQIHAEVPGRVLERAEVCRAGHYVEQGQLLATIDPEDYQLEVERLDKEWQQASVALEELDEQIRGAESLLELAEKEVELRASELERTRRLGPSAISVSDLEKVQVSELTARNALETLRNRISLLRVSRGRLESARDLAAAGRKKAQLDLQRTRIVAPVAGVVVDDSVEEDAYVQRGTLLLTIEDTAKAEVKCKLTMEDLYWLWDRPHAAAELADGDSAGSPHVAAAYGIPEAEVEVVYHLPGHRDFEYVWRGRLERFDGLGLDEKTRTVPCRVVVDQPRQRRPATASGPPALLRGMYVTIRIPIEPKTRLLEVPEVAVRPGNVVWRVRRGELAIVPVNFVALAEAGAEGARPALVYVDSASDASPPGALQPGDQVVVSPLHYVRTGMAIETAVAGERSGS